MCPLTHIYIATKVTGTESPLLIIGSVLPDFVWMSGKFPSDKLHDNPIDFYDFIKSCDKEMLDLGLGMLLHSNAKGADYYSHFYKGGYAMTKGKRLTKDLVNLFNSKDEKLNLYKAHNFIEAALDMHLLKNNQHLPILYKDAIKKIDIEKITQLIYEFTKLDSKLIRRDLALFFKIFGPESVSSEQAFVSDFFPPILKAAFHQKASAKEILSVLNRAKIITEKDWEDLVSMIIPRMKKDFSEFI